VALARLVPDLDATIKEAEPPLPSAPQVAEESRALWRGRQVFRADNDGLDAFGGQIVGRGLHFGGWRFASGCGRRNRLVFATGGDELPKQKNEQAPEAEKQQFDDAVEQGILVATADSNKR
jgi:hypothetical protein